MAVLFVCLIAALEIVGCGGGGHTSTSYTKINNDNETTPSDTAIHGPQIAWKWLYPRPQGNDLNSVYFVDNNIGYVVGDSGTIIKTIDGGMSWSILNTNSLGHLYSIHCPSSGSICFAVGKNGILSTIDGGLSWTSDQTDVRFSDIYCPSNDVCFAVSYSESSNIYKTISSGATWSVLNTPESQYLNVIYCSQDGQNCLAGGNRKTLLKTTNGGEEWRIISLPENLYLQLFLDIECDSDFTDCIATLDYSQLIISHDGGESWELKYQEADFGGDLSCIFNENTCYSASTSRLYKTTDLGETWVPALNGFRGGLSSIHCPENSKTCYTVGDRNILKTNTSGDYWSYLSYMDYTAKSPFLYSYLENIACDESATTCIAAGMYGVYSTSDSGNSWNYLDEAFLWNISGMDCTKDLSMCFIGFQADTMPNEIQNSTDMGITWNSLGKELIDTMDISCPSIDNCVLIQHWNINLGDIYDYKPRKYSAECDCFLSWSYSTQAVINSVYCDIDPNYCYLAGSNGTVAKLDSNTNSWSELITGFTHDLNSIYCSSQNTCIAVGDDGAIIQSIDGGDSWTDESCADCNNLHSTNCLNDGLRCFASGEDGEFLKSADGGQNWIREKSGTLNDLNNIYCSRSVDMCYIVGSSDTIMQIISVE